MSDPFPHEKPPSSTSSSAAGAVSATTAPLMAPRRDKFAALAQHQQQAAAAVSSSEVTTSATTTNSTPRRDKHAALAARRAATSDSELPLQPSSANELGALAQQQSLEATDSDSIAATLQATALRRHAVWHDLDRAEASVMHLLQAARTTARQLAASVSNAESNAGATLTDSASDYFQALQSIHDLLAPHADLVQAYTAPQRPALMYQARVERRLAQDRRALLNTWRELEVLEATTTRTVTPVVSSTNEPPVDATSSKRKRE
jgi:hypothetical protein